MWLLVICIGTILTTITAESPFTIDFTCSNNKFDISSLECSACDASLSLSASYDKSTCLPCDASTGAVYNASTLQCQCNSWDQYLSDLEDETICTQCPTNYALSLTDTNRYECVLCESPKTIDATNNNKCLCPSTTHIETKSGEGCVSQTDSTTITTDYTLSSSKQVSFQNIETSEIITVSDSLLFGHYFLDSAVNCKIYNDITSCQILGNLCVLTMYNKLHNVCKLFIEVSDSITSVSNDFSNWKQNLPFLFYPNHNILTSTALSSLSVTLNDELSIILVKYSMNGTMIGYQQLSDELFYFCGSTINENDQAKVTKVGYNTDISCTYDLSTIFNANTNTDNWDDLIFYDPYLYLASENTYYPLPVYINNIDNNDGYKVVRRFFISDNFASNNEVLMYLQSAVFKVTVYDENKIYPPLIEIQYGLKQLDEMTTDSKTADISFKGYYNKDLSNFETSITILFVITLIIIVIIWIYKVYKYQRLGMINTINVNAPNTQSTTDLNWFIRIVFIGFGVSSHLFFWLLCFVSSYCYLSFKGQSSIKFLLPQSEDSMVIAFKALLIYCFLAKLLHILMLIYDQCNVDVFFVDWEKPKGNIMAMIQQQQFMYQQQQHHQQQQPYSMQSQFIQQQQSWNMNMPSYGNMNQMNQRQPQQSVNFSPNRSSNQIMSNNHSQNSAYKTMTDFGIISCWRKLFVANEWNELSVYRNISPSLTFFIFLLFMTGFEFEYLSLQKPIASGSSADTIITPISIIYKFVISTFFLIIIYCTQYLYYFFVNDRFCSSDKFIDLIDLSSLANISIFILDSRYHGFYIHGKTIHQHADTSLEEINKNIENERRNLCKSRGLVPDKDTFEIFVSTQFRQQYDEIYRDVLQYEVNKLNQHRRISFDINNDNNNNQNVQNNQEADHHNENEQNYNILLSKQLIESSKLLSMFLCDFIERSCPHKWELRELLGFERFFGPLPDLFNERNSIFYDDVMCKFKTQLMYIGLQYDLIIFTILTFCFIDEVILNENNTIISILLTYIIDYVLMKIRSYFGERNVSRKTMIDQKFLL